MAAKSGGLRVISAEPGSPPTSEVDPAQPVFFYDLGSAACYLVAEQVNAIFGVVPEWEPVHAPSAGLSNAQLEREEATALAAELALQELRWPRRWPPDTHTTMLAATYAKRVGRGVAYSLAAFRQAFAGGRDLADLDTVLIAGAACEMHPTALTRGLETRGVSEALAAAGGRARREGVVELPAIRLGDSLLQGSSCLAAAIGRLGARP